MAYGIIRAEKVKMAKINSNLQAHHQREKDKYYSNPDIDPARTKDNVCLIHCDNFREEVNKQIQQHNIKKVRSDAVGMIDIISTCSGEFFANKSREWIIEYFKRQMPLIQKEFGIVVSMNIHFDEKNVHAHACTVPIIKNQNGTYSLSAKRIMGNQKDYIARQDRFYEQWFSKFGLERGISAKESHREHLDTIAYKAQMEHDKLLMTQSDLKDSIQQINGLRGKLQQCTAKLDKIRQEEKTQSNKLSKEIRTFDNVLQNERKVTRNISKKQSELDEIKQQLTNIDSILQQKNTELNDIMQYLTESGYKDKVTLDLMYQNEPEFVEYYQNLAQEHIEQEFSTQQNDDISL